MLRWLLPLCALFLAPSTAHAEWREAASRHFVIYSQSGEAELRQAASDLERFDAMLRQALVLPADSPTKLKIYLMPDQAGVMRVLGEEEETGVAGFYAVSPRGALAIGMDGRTGDSEFDLSRRDILFHEYVHHLMAQHSDAAYPLWYAEGFAEYYAMTAFLADGTIQTGGTARHRLAVLNEGDWIPVDLLVGTRGSVDAGGSDALFYAEGWLLVHYLAHEPSRRGQLERYLAAINRGDGPETAAVQAFGGLAQLDGELRDYAQRPWLTSLRMTPEARTATAIGIRVLGAGESALLPYEAMLGRGIAPRGRKRFVREVREVARLYPDDPQALALLAAAELQAGRRRAAQAAVDRWIALRPDEPRALMYKSMVGFADLSAKRSTDEAKWAKARQWIERARRTAPRDPMVMDIYYDSFTIQGVAPPPDASDGIIRALQLVPQFDDLRLKVASDYERRNHIEAAILAVKPAAFRSEGPGAAMDGRANAMLNRLQRKLKTAPRRLASMQRNSSFLPR
jgi:hypothetical protein